MAGGNVRGGNVLDPDYTQPILAGLEVHTKGCARPILYHTHTEPI